MKSFYVALLLVIIVALLPSLAFSQNTYFQEYLEFNTLGGGARAAGMGGAFLGLSEGEYAYAWNPAGMVFAEKPSIGIQLNSVSDKFSFDHISYSGSLLAFDINQTDAKRSHSRLDFSGFVVPFTFYERQWAVGGGFRNIQDMDIKFEAPGLFNSKDILAQKEGVDAITFGFSGKLMDNIGVGVVANDYIRGGESNNFSGHSFPYQTSGSSVIDTIDQWVNRSSHYSGFNFDLGLAAKYSIFKGGIVVHTPYDLKQDVKETDYFMLPPTPVGLIYRYRATTSIPFSYSLGISAKPLNNLILDFDFDAKPMSKSNQTIDFEMVTIRDTTFALGWKDLNQIRIGAEYAFDAGFASIPLRIGFRNNPSVGKKLTAISEVPFDSNLVTHQATYGSQINTNIMTFGTGLHFQKAWIDLAYQFGSSSYSMEFHTLIPSIQTFQEKRDYSRLFVSAGMNF